jgi:hypothetical protein
MWQLTVVTKRQVDMQRIGHMAKREVNPRAVELAITSHLIALLHDARKAGIYTSILEVN